MSWALRRSGWSIDGEVWVASGDYKLQADGVSAPFEPVRCDAFITESTFALPIYCWRQQAEMMAEVDLWRRDNAAAGLASILYAYALGKAQRVLANLDPDFGPIYCHGAVEAINELHRAAGVRCRRPGSWATPRPTTRAP